MHHILIRFNTKFEEADSPDLKWRVVIDGKEHLASHVKVMVPTETTQDVIEGGILKWHISCYGAPEWDGSEVTIA